MKVLVTGGAGNLGSVTCRVLTDAGHEVIATDVRDRTDLPVPVHVHDLTQRDGVYPLAAGVDAVVHLGNHTDFDPPNPQMIFTENVSMNINAFQAALDQGAKKMVFASPIQVVYSVPRLPEYDPYEMPAYLPLDNDSPAQPTNPYALSKRTGEVMLDYYARVFGISAVAVRWPWMAPRQTLMDAAKNWEKAHPWLKQLLFSYLSYQDAARLINAIISADLPGFRVYLPASMGNLLGLPTVDVVQQYFANVPLRRPIEQMTSLVDISRIEKETGWLPSE